MTVSDINWVAVGRGRLALWHKPGRRAIPGLKRHGCEHVVTLLSAREGAEEVGQAVRNEGMDWSWIPLASGRPPQGRQNAPIVEALPRLSAELDAGKSLLIHCSAGMHRTGMITYALLRYRGHGEEAALELIQTLRYHTWTALKREQLQWGSELSAKLASRATP